MAGVNASEGPRWTARTARARDSRARVVFPGGFGTLDELTEILTLVQTRKFDRPIKILLFGPDYWNEIINFDALVRHGMISAEDLALFQLVDDPHTALRLFQEGLAPTSPRGDSRFRVLARRPHVTSPAAAVRIRSGAPRTTTRLPGGSSRSAQPVDEMAMRSTTSLTPGAAQAAHFASFTD